MREENGGKLTWVWSVLPRPAQTMFFVPENLSQAKFSKPAILKSRFLQAPCVLYLTECKSEGFNSGISLWGDANESTYLKAY